MTTSKLDDLRANAKRLKKAFAQGDAETAARICKIIPVTKPPKHADFLHVIACENGYESWPRLKFALDSQEMSRDQRAERLKIALYYGQRWVIEKLLSDDAALPEHNLGLQIALYDVGAVKTALKTKSKATELIGIRSPILHLTYSQYIHIAPERQSEMLEIAELLLENGADPNDGFASEPGSDHTISALYGALGHAGNLVLAEWLLRQGATPDDNESLYHATELGHADGIKLLIKYGVKTSGTNALPRAIDFQNLEMVQLLLEHGADPNEAVKDHPSGQPVDTIPALHQAARRWCSGEMARLLMASGADGLAVWQGHTPYALAKIFGNEDFAHALEAAGCATPLSASEIALAHCASGKSAGLKIDPAQLGSEDRLLLTRIVLEPTRLDHVKSLIRAGFDPNQKDEMGMTPLHTAGWAGLPDAVAYLLSFNPDLNYKNDFGGDALGTIIHGAEHRLDSADRNHVKCAELLLNAGAELRQEEIDATGSEKMALFLESWKAEHG